MTEFILRTNGAINPRPTSGGAAGWTTARGFGGGAGTYTFVSSPTGPFGATFPVRRKNWTTSGTNAANAGFQINADAANYFPVAPGERITVSGFIRRIGAASTSKTWVCRISWWNQVGTAGATQVGATVSGTGVPDAGLNAWSRLSLNATVPAGAAGMSVFLDTAAVGSAPFLAGDGLDAAALLIERSSGVLLDYFDGDTEGYRWAGTANASVSQQVSAVLPVPVGGDRARDAALHIRALAVAIDTALSTPTAVAIFDTGEVRANASGVVTVTVPALASVSGAIAGPVDLLDNLGVVSVGQWPDSNYMSLPVRDPAATGNTLSFRCVNPATGGTNAGRFVRLIGVAWGPAAGAALQGSAMAAVLPPGTRFARGVTPRGLRYPGTDEPQWKTAAAIGELADDIDTALAGLPAGLVLHTWRGTIEPEDASATSYIRVPFGDRLSVVRGAVATVWDNNATPRSTFYAWNGVRTLPDLWPTARLRALTSAPFNVAGGGDWPAGVAGTQRLSVIAWGDPA